MEQRNLALDLIRVLACLMVVAMHVPIPLGLQMFFPSSLSYVTAPCIGCSLWFLDLFYYQ